MRSPAPLAVTVEVRALDVGPEVERAWRVTDSIGDEGVRFERELPWEPDRPVSLTFRLPDDTAPPLQLAGTIIAPDAVRFAPLDIEARRRIVRYVQERMLER
jgi:hypothetical protein